MEALSRGLDLSLYVADMRQMGGHVPETGFDVVICMDNALPHLSRFLAKPFRHSTLLMEVNRLLKLNAAAAANKVSV
jgi:hypothetical protein